MKLFERFRPAPRRIHVDPLFGRLECRGTSAWRGAVAFPPLSREVAVAIATGGTEPGEAHRNAFLELARRYGDLLPAIARELYALYMPENGGAPGHSPHPSGSGDMVPLTHLDCVEIERDGRLRLLYGFVEGAGWDDAMFAIGLTGWTPRGEHLGD